MPHWRIRGTVMPVITHALLYAGYALVSLTIGLALSQIGGGSGAASFLGGIAFFSACAITHGGIAAASAAGLIGRTEKRIRSDIDKLRAAQREIITDIDAIAARMEDVDRRIDAIGDTPAAIAAAPTPEIKMIDQIVDKLSRTMDQRFEDIRRISGPTETRAHGPIDIVREALIDNRVELHLQPIVSLPQRRTSFYEGFTRLKDPTGRLILPQEFIPAAERAGLMAMIDNMLLFRCVQIVRKLQQNDRRIGIFCNIAPAALADEAFFPHFLDFMRDHTDLAGAVIFEIPLSAFDARTAIEARAMAKLADLGFRFSVDKISRIDIDLPDLERSGVRYLKIPASMILEDVVRKGARPRSNITREIDAADVAAVCMRYGVDIIAERIESEDIVPEILELDIPYGQGHLFGAPRAIKESLMEETAPPADFLRSIRNKVA
ncbi:MAG: EAL domain-containing protein [Alphaproteobacteria bacterium]|nr:EAL domain-containing protein [Alphaproteobacteria bacterium]